MASIRLISTPSSTTALPGSVSIELATHEVVVSDLVRSGILVGGVFNVAGRLMDFLLAPGQEHELEPSLTLLHGLPEAPSWVPADMACDARVFR